MAHNRTGIGRETALFTAAFLIGYILASQQHALEAAQLREAVKVSQQHVLHLMALMARTHNP